MKSTKSPRDRIVDAKPRHARLRGAGFAGDSAPKAPLRLIVLLALLVPGCTTPPSIAPLLRVVDQALADEAAHLDADAARDAAAMQQSRAMLADAYEADLKQTADLSPQWVLDATDAYVAAREIVLRHEFDLQAQRRQRADNLAAARQAQQRAMQLLERQDELVTGAMNRLRLP
ncbi:MAG: hypothetical protein WD042_05730 [Phycisphaeraceae bacterium]